MVSEYFNYKYYNKEVNKMKLKKLKNIKQFINIYKLYQSSFPIEEKKPFWLIIIGVFRKNFEVFSLSKLQY